MLSIPQHFSKADDIRTGFQKFLTIVYGHDPAMVGKLTKDVEALQTLRNKATVNNISEVTLVDIAVYHEAMLKIMPHFVGYEREINIKFSWTDAFRPQLISSSTSIYFDWASILWNYGAGCCTFGSSADSNSDEGLRQAAKFYQKAAGAFDTILETIYSKIDGTNIPCLSRESLSFCKHLCLGQAQQCFYQKAIKEKRAGGSMNAALIAKLASETSSLFEQACNFSLHGTIASSLDVSWKNACRYNAILYYAAALYWQSQASCETAKQTGRGYGEQISRLSQCIDQCNQAITLLRQTKLPSTLENSADELLKKATADKITAEKDNNTVYLEAIPSTSTLASIPGARIVKLMPVTVPEGTEVPSLFQDILPRSILKFQASLDDQLVAIWRRWSVESENATNEGRVMLSSLGLPASVESFRQGGGIPSSIWEKVLHIQQSMGGIKNIYNKMTDLSNCSRRILQTVSQIEGSITNEVDLDQSFRYQYQNLKEIDLVPKSEFVQKDILGEFYRLKSAFEKAQSTDLSIIASMLSQDAVFVSLVEDDINFMKRQRSVRDWIIGILDHSISAPALQLCDKVVTASNMQGLFDLLSKKDDQSIVSSNVDLLDFSEVSLSDVSKAREKASKTESTIAELEDQLVNLAQVFEKRETKTNLLKQCCLSENAKNMYLDSLLKLFNVSMAEKDAFLEAEVGRIVSSVETVKKDIQDSLEEQKKILELIVKLNSSFLTAVQTDSKTIERNRIIGDIEVSLAKYYGWLSQLNSGIAFYGDLQSRLSKLLLQSDDVSYSQKILRMEFESNLMQQKERLAQEQRDREYALMIEREAQASNSSSHAAAASVSNSSMGSSAPLPSAPVANAPPMSYAYPSLSNGNTSMNFQQGQPISSFASPQIGNQGTPVISFSNLNAAPTLPPSPYQNQSLPSSVGSSTTMASSSGYSYHSSPEMSQLAPPPSSTTSSIPQAQIDRLAEMGFPRDAVVEALYQNHGDENLALNMLLNGSSSSSTSSTASTAPTSGSTSSGNDAGPSSKGFLSFLRRK